jgi:hypothetical protein
MKMIILAAFTLAACKPQVWYKEICTVANKDQYNKVMEICMKGQRQHTVTDDADDVIKQCRFAAHESAKTCKNILVVGDPQRYNHAPCDETKITEEIAECKRVAP